MKTPTPEGLPREELAQGLYILKLLAAAAGFLLRRAVGMVAAYLRAAGFEPKVATGG